MIIQEEIESIIVIVNQFNHMSFNNMEDIGHNLALDLLIILY
jgi:hypothetical protein